MRAVASILSMIVAALMLAQPVLAGKADTVILNDAKDDMMKMYFTFANGGPSWPDRSPIQLSDCVDVKLVSISEQKDSFVLTMTMWCDDLLSELALPPGTNQIKWGFGINTDFDYDSEFYLGACYDGSTLYPVAATAGGDPIEIGLSFAGPTLIVTLDEDFIGDPASFAWNYFVIVSWSPPELMTWGGWWTVDNIDTWKDTMWAHWPA